jgi:hypothetical protein
MWKKLKKMLGADEVIPGFAEVNEGIRSASELISRCVAVQIVESGASSNQLEVMRSFILGYIATLAEQLAQSVGKNDPQGTAILMSILAAAKLAGKGASHQAIAEEFEELRALRDYGFGQGGAVALEVFEVLLKREDPQGLKEHLTPA